MLEFRLKNIHRSSLIIVIRVIDKKKNGVQHLIRLISFEFERNDRKYMAHLQVELETHQIIAFKWFGFTKDLRWKLTCPFNLFTDDFEERIAAIGTVNNKLTQ